MDSEPQLDIRLNMRLDACLSNPEPAYGSGGGTSSSGNDTKVSLIAGGRGAAAAAAAAAGVRSLASSSPCCIKFSNNDPVNTYVIVWVDHQGELVARTELRPGHIVVESTFATHPWWILGMPPGYNDDRDDDDDDDEDGSGGWLPMSTIVERSWTDIMGELMRKTRFGGFLSGGSRSFRTTRASSAPPTLILEFLVDHTNSLILFVASTWMAPPPIASLARVPVTLSEQAVQEGSSLSLLWNPQARDKVLFDPGRRRDSLSLMVRAAPMERPSSASSSSSKARRGHRDRQNAAAQLPEYGDDHGSGGGGGGNAGRKGPRTGAAASSTDPLWMHRRLMQERGHPAQRMQTHLTVVIVPR